MKPVRWKTDPADRIGPDSLESPGDAKMAYVQSALSVCIGHLFVDRTLKSLGSDSVGRVRFPADWLAVGFKFDRWSGEINLDVHPQNPECSLLFGACCVSFSHLNPNSPLLLFCRGSDGRGMLNGFPSCKKHVVHQSELCGQVGGGRNGASTCTRIMPQSPGWGLLGFVEILERRFRYVPKHPS